MTSGAGFENGRGEWASLLRIVVNVLRAALLALLAVALFERDVFEAVVAVGAFALSFLPVVIGRVTDSSTVPLAPAALATLAVAQVAGGTLDLYEQHPIAYDVFAHVVETGAAVVLVVLLADRADRPVATGRLPIACASIGLALAIGWEVIEAIGSAVTGGNFQHGWDDTVVDMAAGVVGALIAAWVVGADRRHRHPSG